MTKRRHDEEEDSHMEERRPRERELVLAPNEYAYVLDTTKGHVNCYVGPNKTSLAQTDQTVIFNGETQRFESVEMKRAITLFTTAPTNAYVELRNPALQGVRPAPGASNAAVELRIGEKINLRGPISFPLWPGQQAKVIEGHRLRSNQYSYVHIHDPGAAREGWDLPGEPPSFVTGEKLIIRGTDVSFFIPPNGVEVLPDARGRYVRDAVTLQRLEYCVLVKEDGTKRYVRGEAVVFPEPNEVFQQTDGRRAFRAIELNEITGLYIKVIAPYVDDDGTAHVEGEELFITGNEIYFPREEHAIIRHDGRELHQAVAIPKGSGRYVLDRMTGDVMLVRGPRMYLPDPRREVLARRILSAKEQQLFGVGETPQSKVDQTIGPIEVEELEEIDGFERPPFREPRSIVLGEAGGAVRVEVRSGYAVQVVDRAGARRVVLGPASELLEYDETLETLRLSTEVPKSRHARLETAHLRVAGNEVTDRLRVVSSDLVSAELLLKYRVSFEGQDASLWFAVEDYVELLCDHARSKLQAVLRRTPIRDMRDRVTDIVRDTLLGARNEEGLRLGLAFAENGMRVYDVEVLELEVLDAAVDELLAGAQMSAIKSAVVVAEKETALVNQRRAEEIDRDLARANHDTELLRLALEEERRERSAEMERTRAERALADAEMELQVKSKQLETERALHLADLEKRGDLQSLALKDLEARVKAAVDQAQAFSPHLVMALERLADEQLLSALSTNFSELAAIEGRGILETAQKFLDFVPSTMLPVLKKNGAA